MRARKAALHVCKECATRVQGVWWSPAAPAPMGRAPMGHLWGEQAQCTACVPCACYMLHVHVCYMLHACMHACTMHLWGEQVQYTVHCMRALCLLPCTGHLLGGVALLLLGLLAEDRAAREQAAEGVHVWMAGRVGLRRAGGSQPGRERARCGTRKFGEEARDISPKGVVL